MKAVFDGTSVRCGRDGKVLYEQGGFGRVEGGHLRLAPQEAIYLLQRGKIEIEGFDLDRFIAVFAGQPDVVRSFLVYRDIRERGYAVQTGPHDFRVFKRGQRSGTGESIYLVRILSERDPVRFSELTDEVATAHNMRKQYVLAVVDDEDELTYYEIKIQKLPVLPAVLSLSRASGIFAGRSVMAKIPEGSPFEQAWFGSRLDETRLLFAPLETLYLADKGILLVTADNKDVPQEQIFRRAQESDSEFPLKAKVYADLRDRGYIPKTGYKFGHHFRVYSGGKAHSEMLVHAMETAAGVPMSTISRSVRLAHSVKKKMLFACVYSTGIQYVEFARIKL